MDRKREDLDKLKADLGWSMVKKVKSEVQKVEEIIEKSNMKIEMYQEKILNDAEQRKEMLLEKVCHFFVSFFQQAYLQLIWIFLSRKILNDKFKP
jgi:hypothetical protein